LKIEKILGEVWVSFHFLSCSSKLLYSLVGIDHGSHKCNNLKSEKNIMCMHYDSICLIKFIPKIFFVVSFSFITILTCFNFQFSYWIVISIQHKHNSKTSKHKYILNYCFNSHDCIQLLFQFNTDTIQKLQNINAMDMKWHQFLFFKNVHIDG
jgi:hypothetical protein